jgi:pilus assembly protein TadC
MLVTGVSVSVHAGHSVVGACLGLRDVNECGARIAERLDRGEPLDDALDELARFFGDTGAALKQLITDCASSGLPLRRAADRLAESLRQRRAAAIAVRAQQLTTALSMPIVLCMLPSFGLAVLMPLVVASLSSLSSST